LFVCHLPPTLGPVAGAETFADVGLVILEISTPVEMTYRGCQLHAFGIHQKLFKPMFRDIPALKTPTALWRKALNSFDDSARADGAAQILEVVTGDTRRERLVRSIVQETRSSPTDLQFSLGRLREIFPGPICIVLRHFKYLPDGRVADWPPGFVEETRTVAKIWAYRYSIQPLR
jgi:hypothetical protein